MRLNFLLSLWCVAVLAGGFSVFVGEAAGQKTVEVRANLTIKAIDAHSSTYWKVILVSTAEEITRNPKGLADDFVNLLAGENGELTKARGERYSGAIHALRVFLQENNADLQNYQLIREQGRPSKEQAAEGVEKVKKLVIIVRLPEIKELHFILSTAKSKIENIPPIILDPEPHLASVLQGTGTLTPPQTLSDGRKKYDYDKVGLERKQEKNVALWGRRLTYRYTYTKDDVIHVEQTFVPFRKCKNAECELVMQLDAIAVQVMAATVKKGIAPNEIYSKEAARKAFASALGIVLGYTPEIRSPDLRPGGRLFLVAEDLVFSKKVKFTLEDPKTDEAEEDDPDLLKKLKDQYLGTNEEDQSRRLLTHEGHFYLTAAMDADEKYLARDPQVLKAEWLTNSASFDGSEGFLEMLVTPPAQIFKSLTLYAGFDYTPERALTGKFGADLAKMIDGVESLQFELQGGGKSLTGTGKIVVPLPHDPTRLFRDPRLRIEGKLDNRDTYRLGNVSRQDFKAEDRVAEAGLHWKYNSMTHLDRFEAKRMLYKSRKRTRHLGSVEAGVRWRDFSFDDSDDLNTASLDEGLISSPYVRIKPGLLFNEEILIHGEIDLSGGLEELGGDFDYLKAKGILGILSRFHRDGKPFAYVDHRWTGGWAGSGSPSFDYFGAGEDGFVRGLEQDEFIGRRYVAARTEFGFSIQKIIDRFTDRKQKTESEQNEKALKKKKAEAAVSSDEDAFLRGTYLGVFADAGWLADQIVDGVTVDDTRNLQGFGVHIRMIDSAIGDFPASFSIGYSYSPQSKQHESGFVYSEVSIAF